MHDVEGLDKAARRMDLQDLTVKEDLAIGRFAGPTRADLLVRDAECAIRVLARELGIGRTLSNRGSGEPGSKGAEVQR